MTDEMRRKVENSKLVITEYITQRIDEEINADEKNWSEIKSLNALRKSIWDLNIG